MASHMVTLIVALTRDKAMEHSLGVELVEEAFATGRVFHQVAEQLKIDNY